VKWVSVEIAAMSMKARSPHLSAKGPSAGVHSIESEFCAKASGHQLLTYIREPRQSRIDVSQAERLELKKTANSKEIVSRKRYSERRMLSDTKLGIRNKRMELKCLRLDECDLNRLTISHSLEVCATSIRIPSTSLTSFFQSQLVTSASRGAPFLPEYTIYRPCVEALPSHWILKGLSSPSLSTTS
jgi:hypothetical protein